MTKVVTIFVGSIYGAANNALCSSICCWLGPEVSSMAVLAVPEASGCMYLYSASASSRDLSRKNIDSILRDIRNRPSKTSFEASTTLPQNFAHSWIMFAVSETDIPLISSSVYARIFPEGFSLSTEVCAEAQQKNKSIIQVENHQEMS